MFIHSVVFVILSILSATAVYAASMPISKEPQEKQHASGDDKDTNTAL
jgi:hypothetical protein